MGLSGPVWRLSAKRLEAALRALAPAAAELSVRLGHDAGKDAEAAVGR
jgi:hypothetical protein